MASRMLDRGEDDELTHPDLKPPVFSDPVEERAHRKARLAGACRIFAKLGYDHWVAGHITVRDPLRANHFWANPLGVSWHRIRASDLLLVDFDANVVEGERPLNAAAFAIHAELHANRDDIVAAAHAHTPYGRAWSATGRPLEPISQDHCAFYGDHAVFGWRSPDFYCIRGWVPSRGRRQWDGIRSCPQVLASQRSTVTG